LGCSANEAEISREELGVFVVYVDEGLPDYFFMACVAHICN
jgi:hypothetical protein